VEATSASASLRRVFCALVLQKQWLVDGNEDEDERDGVGAERRPASLGGRAEGGEQEREGECSASPSVARRRGVWRRGVMLNS